MNDGIIALVELLARRRGSDLAPNWTGDAAQDDEIYETEQGLEALASRVGWKPPVPVQGRPRPNQFPLLVFKRSRGWAIAEQWETVETIRVSTTRGHDVWDFDKSIQIFDVSLPRLIGEEENPKAIKVFLRALWLRKPVFISAFIATIIVNIVTLATSLYSMQVYDRVIPRGSYATLWVLTVGVFCALLLDFALRTTRALMIEREASKIDAEVSEFFFARAQAIRLDARPAGVGTMAAQLRGLEQVRSLLSSGTIFLAADLPFALFFILVISSLGGPVAIIPLVSFPLALMLAVLFARLIRNDASKAQVSGNRKNGLLVEALDAAEVVKANRGGWHMQARWNDLMDEVQLYEDPVKRWSSVAGSVFGALQQFAYVGVIAWGAIRVAEGEMTMGALIACSIIAGRVNGPLVSQLPNFLVQWGYARSTLNALDGILSLPLDQTPGTESLRPERIDGPLRVRQLKFAYPQSRSGVEIPALDITPGERVAIIGGIGSGKSTLLRLLAGLYAPAEGTVSVAGLDMRHIAPDILRRHIGYLPQDTRLLNGTLRDNLLLGLNNPGDDAVLAAAEASGLASLITGHPLGLELPISEGGRGLSGGQRTLSGLTRLLLANPPVWLLDEPTANLDQSTEARILAALREKLAPTSTLVLVTHRMGLLSLVNRVIVMTGGRIALDGPTADVIAQLKKPKTATPLQPVAAGNAA